MKLEYAILAALGRDDLKRIFDALGLPHADHPNIKAMRGELSRSRWATVEDLLPLLSKDVLKAVCHLMDVPTKGTREDLMNRLSGNGEGCSD